ncbi:MAG: hypothetical protein A2749_00870 [Parcubacteria group bacterium RIFCSPHIGHO2_01_FULL_45_26]|nr:MAG: hypothetical protein A2749_00870 [Parcubacteria group bacterium RIFCSPHIGHO2_01_FULL_45_26]
MFHVHFKPTFVRQFKKLESRLQDEAEEKIELLKNAKNHGLLKVHKLHGPLKSYFSFSVNFRTRIVFYHLSKNEIVLVSIGDHDTYDT